LPVAAVVVLTVAAVRARVDFAHPQEHQVAIVLRNRN
jgi:hypothetical protein